MILLCLIFLSALNITFSAEHKNSIITNQKENKFAIKECNNEYSELCFKIDMINIVEKLSNTNKINILQSLSIVKEVLVNDTSSEDIVAGE